MNRKALGRGIEALIPDFEKGVTSSNIPEGLVDLLIDAIVPNHLQPRKKFEDQKFKELEKSIREKEYSNRL